MYVFTRSRNRVGVLRFQKVGYVTLINPLMEALSFFC